MTGDNELADRFLADWRQAAIEPQTRTLLEYAEKVTLTPAECTGEDLEKLRRTGYSDEQIHDAVQVIAYFNYINRIADALGVDPEPEGDP